MLLYSVLHIIGHKVLDDSLLNITHTLNLLYAQFYLLCCISSLFRADIWKQ